MPSDFQNGLSAAIREAYASAPSDEVILHTLEFRHSAFTTPIRVVMDHIAHNLTLEATAPANPSETVEFLAFTFEMTPPEIGDSGVPEIGIRIDNVDRSIIDNIELAMESFEKIEVTYRPYLASDTTGPQMNPPMTFQVASIEADVFSITASCTFGDMSNKSFPGETYTAKRFPGLVT